MCMTEITYKLDLENVNWSEIKAKVQADDFDNGRTPAQLETSFRNSQATVIAYAGDEIVGKVRALLRRRLQCLCGRCLDLYALPRARHCQSHAGAIR